MKELELEAEKYAAKYSQKVGRKYGFFDGATSEAAKEYWKKQLEKEKLEFAIEQFKSLKDVEHSDNFWYLENKILELQQKLIELNKNS